MQKLTIAILILAIVFLPVELMAEMQLGIGYGKQFRGYTNLEQVEVFYRLSLPYATQWGEKTDVATNLEFAGAIIREDVADSNYAGRFSLMPLVTVSPYKYLNFIAGVGVGAMVGETDFTRHKLGGPFCFLSKIGLLLHLTDAVSLEFTYFHQSNADIYEHNGSLNMHRIAVSYHF